MGHARSLITIEKTDIQLKIYQLIIKGKLSVRKTEELVRSLKNEKIIVSDKKKEDNELTKIESKLSSFWNKISTQGDENSGKIIVPYKSTNDLNRILELLDII